MMDRPHYYQHCYNLVGGAASVSQRQHCQKPTLQLPSLSPVHDYSGTLRPLPASPNVKERGGASSKGQLGGGGGVFATFSYEEGGIKGCVVESEPLDIEERRGSQARRVSHEEETGRLSPPPSHEEGEMKRPHCWMASPDVEESMGEASFDVQQGQSSRAPPTSSLP